MLILQFIAAVVPGVVLLWYIWKRDLQPEPTQWLLRALFAGVVICLPVALVEAGIQELLFGGNEPSTYLGTTVMAFFVAAVPEESFKLLALWLVLRKNPYFDEHFDGIVYAVFVSLGFAILENISYVLKEDDWLGVAFVRAFLAVPGHYAFGVFMGYYYSLYHFVDHSPRMGAKVLLMPVLAHGIYDSIAMSEMVNPYVGGLAFILLCYFCVKMHKRVKTRMLALLKRDWPFIDFKV